MLRWPAKVKPQVSDVFVCQMDLLASFASLLGQTYPDKVDSENTLDAFLGKSKKEVVQPYYYVQFDNHATGYRGLRTSTHTFAVHATNGKIDETVLFDRTKDPYQMDNIAGQSRQTK